MLSVLHCPRSQLVLGVPLADNLIYLDGSGREAFLLGSLLGCASWFPSGGTTRTGRFEVECPRPEACCHLTLNHFLETPLLLKMVEKVLEVCHGLTGLCSVFSRRWRPWWTVVDTAEVL